MIVLLFIAQSVWHFPVPWWMWLISVIDGVATFRTGWVGK